MGKQLKFTKKEKKTIQYCISALGAILLDKMDKGVTAPTVDGIMELTDCDREVVFSFTAQKKTNDSKT